MKVQGLKLSKEDTDLVKELMADVTNAEDQLLTEDEEGIFEEDFEDIEDIEDFDMVGEDFEDITIDTDAELPDIDDEFMSGEVSEESDVAFEEDLLGLESDVTEDNEVIGKKIQNRVKRDWLALDYIVFGRPIRTENSELATEWNVLKIGLLSDFYRKTVLYNDLSQCCIEDINEDAKSLAYKARKMAVVYLKEHRDETRPIATDIAKKVFLSEDALSKAVKLLVVHEALANLVGESNNHVRNICKFVARIMRS